MPYIKQEDYDRAAVEPAVPGELNYALTLKAIDYVRNPEESASGLSIKAIGLAVEYIQRVGLSYTNGNAVIGVLNCAGREVKRRLMENSEADELVARVIEAFDSAADYIYDDVIAPYEDTKIDENGDVYPEDIV